MADHGASVAVEQAIALARGAAARGDEVGARRALASVAGFTTGEPRVLLQVGGAALELRDYAFAERCFRTIVDRDPSAVPGWCSLALALALQRRGKEAFACARRALEGAPKSLAAARVYASTAVQAGEFGAAIAACRDALDRFPDDVGMSCQLADALRAMGARDEARMLLQSIASTARATPELHAILGQLLCELGDYRSAAERLRRGIEGGHATARAWHSLGSAYHWLRQYELAEHAFRTALAHDPTLLEAQAGIVYLQRAMCRWDVAASEERKWASAAAGGTESAACPPLTSLYVESTSECQLAVAMAWSKGRYPQMAAPAAVGSLGTHLRIGYLSADFHAHATAYLMAGLFERHDRRRVEVFAYSCGPDDGSPVRGRLRAAIGHWVEGARLSDEALAQRIGADGIDVLVELNGHMFGNRLGVLAWRPAPVQLHYLGYPGTLGFDGVDAIVADDIVVPPGDDVHYHERVWRLPRCYQVNDRGRGLPPRPARTTLGLADDWLVLACFNQTYKLSRSYFSIWLRALEQEPRAVLWLLASNESAQANLRAEAARAGIDPSRLVFAPNVSQDEHIARLRAADLALDVLPCGSHTTGSDALWAGVPLLSCRGKTFAGRVGASLLAAVGLPELVTESVDEYSAALLRLAGDRDRLAGYRDYLERGREDFALFDTDGFALDWERLLADASAGGRTRAA